MKMPTVRILSGAVSFLLAVSACGGSESAPGGGAERGGTIVLAGAGEPEHLMPPVIQSLPAKQVSDMVFEQLAHLGPSLNTLGDNDFVPIAAESWSWSTDSGAVTFQLRGNARFHDGRLVSAEDVKFSYEVFADPVVASPHSSNFPKIDSVVVEDSLHVRFVFADRSPERFFKLSTNLTVLPKHLVGGVDRAKLAESPFASAPVGSGPYRFVRWERGSAIYLEADTARLREKPFADRLVWRYGADLNAAARSIVAGEADFTEALRPEGLALVKPDGPARPVEHAALNHGYLLFNTRSTANRQQAHPILGDREVRRALVMAVNRDLVARNALDTLFRVSYGPFQAGLWASDTTIAQIKHDVARAGAMLDSAGWRDTNGDGIRDRAGKPLKLMLLVPSVSATRRQMALVVQEQYKQVGVDIVIESLDAAAMLPKLMQGNFDAFIHVQAADASPSTIGQVWGSADLDRSTNYGWYANPKVDSLIVKVLAETDRARAKGLYREIYDTIVQDAPAVFIWEPRTIALAHKRIKFESLRRDGWWLGIPSWRIPAAERIERDNIGSR